MKPFTRRIVPRSFLDRYGRWKTQRRNSKKTIEEIFTEIYEENKWGGSRGEFYSGSGSTNDRIASAYLSVISDESVREGFRGLSFVDLGCGDFRIGRLMVPLGSRYTGVDIVRQLIERNQQTYGNATTRFLHLDIVADPLPDGDVCFLRQILQHLSNREISAVLPKLRQYRWVYITEHYPTDNRAIQPNKDKAHGSDVRVIENSGVYLSEPPFNLPSTTLHTVLEIPSDGLGEGHDPGVLRTIRYKPGG
jgi:SAM-dependent methyltransferase